jgi:uncharacterized membrane protein YbhN (UPF0104 family)
VYDRRVVSRLVANRWVRTSILVLVLASCAYGLWLDWPSALAALERLSWYTFALSVAAATAGNWCMMLGWRSVLGDLGSPLPVTAATRINFVAQLGKYVPGVVWAFAAQVELSHDVKVPRRRGFTSVVVSLAISIAVGLMVAAVTLPLASPGVAGRYWWALASVPAILVGLCPPVLGPVLDRVLLLVRQQPLERRPSWRGITQAVGWSALGWLLFGLQVWVLLDDMTGRGASVLMLALGGYALAFCTGLLLVVFPSGIGARELILVATLATAVPHGTAVALALAARVVTTVSDLAWGAIGLAMGRGTRTAPGPAVVSVAPVPAARPGVDR